MNTKDMYPWPDVS